MRFYDFEVYKYDWLVVVKDTDTRKTHVIHNNVALFAELYVPKDNVIWVGYNSGHFDKYIAYGILNGLTPTKIHALSSSIIDGASPYEAMKRFGIREDRRFYNYDCMANDFKSLKQLEGYMGDDIRECKVPFDLDRPLTNEELKEVIVYCEHDVDETIRVFLERKDVFDAKMGLIKSFKLNLSEIGKSEAQLAAIILGATRKPHHDEYDISIIPTLMISKYQEVLNWYKSKPVSGDQLKIVIANIMHILGFGGIHGAIANYNDTGVFVLSDITSMHPAIIIEYDFLSRNVKDKTKYRVIRDDRLVFKTERDVRSESLKLVLNATNGAAKDRYNALYDPRQNNNVCVSAQLVIVDLIEHVEDICQIIQSNTDGILVKLKSIADRPEYIRRCEAWEQRTRLNLEHDDYVKVVQKDVNNYVVVDVHGRYKSKGAYIKKLGPLDNDLDIVNEAVVQHLIKGTSVEDTINNCTSLKRFQRIVKTSSKFTGTLHGNTKLDGHVFRVFASKEYKDPGIFRMKYTRANKVDSSPDHCFIDNTDINRKRIPRKLDKQWYIDLAHERISKFYGMDNYKQIRLF